MYPKLHILEAHVPEFLGYLPVGLGQIDEQGKITYYLIPLNKGEMTRLNNREFNEIP